MKSIVTGFLIIVLSLFNNGLTQEDRVFTSIEEALSVSPDSVYRLDLSKQHLKSIPKELFQFTNLRELDLSKNKLTELPGEFVFDHLEILNLTKNDFEVFPAVICQNTALRQLLMGKNKMSMIPDCIGQLKELRVLDLWFNPITKLPESLTNLRKLKSLDLRGMNYSPEFQKKWSELLPWVKIEFDLGCDCGY